MRTKCAFAAFAQKTALVTEYKQSFCRWEKRMGLADKQLSNSQNRTHLANSCDNIDCLPSWPNARRINAIGRSQCPVLTHRAAMVRYRHHYRLNPRQVL